MSSNFTSGLSLHHKHLHTSAGWCWGKREIIKPSHDLLFFLQPLPHQVVPRQKKKIGGISYGLHSNSPPDREGKLVLHLATGFLNLTAFYLVIFLTKKQNYSGHKKDFKEFCWENRLFHTQTKTCNTGVNLPSNKAMATMTYPVAQCNSPRPLNIPTQPIIYPVQSSVLSVVLVQQPLFVTMQLLHIRHKLDLVYSLYP